MGVYVIDDDGKEEEEEEGRERCREARAQEERPRACVRFRSDDGGAARAACAPPAARYLEDLFARACSSSTRTRA